MRPLTPRVTAVSPPEPETRKVAWLPLTIDSFVVAILSAETRCSNDATNSLRYWIIAASTDMIVSFREVGLTLRNRAIRGWPKASRGRLLGVAAIRPGLSCLVFQG